jgi:hypothetical protein
MLANRLIVSCARALTFCELVCGCLSGSTSRDDRHARNTVALAATKEQRAMFRAKVDGTDF